MNVGMKSLLVMAGLLGICVLGGCADPQCQEENQKLQTYLLKFQEENNKLMAQIDALQSTAPSMDSESLQRLEVEISKRDRKIDALRRALQEMRGQLVLSERVQQQLVDLANELGGELIGNRLRLPGDYLFDSGQFTLRPSARNAIKKFADIMEGYGYMLMITGYTDDDPVKVSRKRGIMDNRHLSLMRAWAVLEQLKKNGYDPDLMYPTGWGELRPVAPNDSKTNKQLNRRVEIFIDPAGSGLMTASAIMDVEAAAPVSVPESPLGGPVIIEE